MTVGVVDADDLLHIRLGLVAEQRAVAILIGLKERVVELTASLAAVERGIKRTGLDKVLEEVAAVAQLRAQTGDGVVVPQRPGPISTVRSSRKRALSRPMQRATWYFFCSGRSR